MADIKGTPGGEKGRRSAYYHDDGNQTHDEAYAAHVRGWDTTDLAWNKVPVDHTTGALKVYSAGGSGTGGPATIADGADVAEGVTTDAAVITDTTGTVSGKLRGLVKWAFERMPASLGQKTMAASFPVALASDQPALAAPTLTKGTQAATGYSVQDLKDSGRVNIMWTAEFAFAQTAETLLTITESRDGAATTTFTTKVVTSGKRLRITSICLEVESLGSGTTPQRCYLRMRFNTAGAVTTGSPLQAVFALGATTAIVKASEKEAWSFPDGIEFLGDGTKQIGFSLETPDWVVTTATGRAKATITAFEY